MAFVLPHYPVFAPLLYIQAKYGGYYIVKDVKVHYSLVPNMSFE